MKRFLVVLCLSAVMLGVMFYFTPKPFSCFAEDFRCDATFFVYCRSTCQQATDMGNGFLVECNAATLDATLQNCNDVDGISVKFCGNEQDFLSLQRRFALQSVCVCQWENIQVVCGYSRKVRGGILLDGKIVNLQIAFDGQTVTVGSPLILDSY